jgi:hypothetical protein
MTAITVITSIPGVCERIDARGQNIGPDYLRACVSSWRDAGYRIVSINGAEEAAAIADAFADVEIRVVARTGMERYGRPLIYMADMLSACDPSSDALIGIVNSDLLLCDPEGLARQLSHHDGRSVFYGARRDIADPAAPQAGLRYAWGLDYFFFPGRAGHALPDAGMLFGHNWWDYWFPTALALQGLRLMPARGLPVAHLQHAEPEMTPERLRAHLEAFKRLFAVAAAALPWRGGEPWTTQANAVLGRVTSEILGEADQGRLMVAVMAFNVTLMLYLNQDPNLIASFQTVWNALIQANWDVYAAGVLTPLNQILDGLADNRVA